VRAIRGIIAPRKGLAAPYYSARVVGYSFIFMIRS